MKNSKISNNFISSFFNKIIRGICSIGGADLETLDTIESEINKHPNEKNVFFVIGILVCVLAVLSVITMNFLIISTMLIEIFTFIIPVFYGIIIFLAYWAILSIGSKSFQFSFIIRLFNFLAIIFISGIVTAGIINKFFTLSYNGITENIFTYLFIFLSINILYTLPVILKKIIINHSKYATDDIFILKIEAENEHYKKLYSERMGDIIADSQCTKHIKIIADQYLECLKYELLLLEKTFESIRKTDEMVAEYNKNNKFIIDDSQINAFKNNIKEQLSLTSKKIKDSMNFNIKK
jgi:hypothetical protein